MASGMSVYYANKVLDDLMRSVEFTVPSTLYCAAFVGSGAAANLRNDIITDEVSVTGTGYARIEVRGASTILFSAANAGQTVNTDDITFDQASGSWGNVYTLALLDATDHVYVYGDLPTFEAIGFPDILRVPASSWTVTL
jgi:hypothetical protein